MPVTVMAITILQSYEEKQIGQWTCVEFVKYLTHINGSLNEWAIILVYDTFRII